MTWLWYSQSSCWGGHLFTEVEPGGVGRKGLGRVWRVWSSHGGPCAKESARGTTVWLPDSTLEAPMHLLQPSVLTESPEPTKSLTLGLGYKSQYFLKPPRWFRSTDSFGNHHCKLFSSNIEGAKSLLIYKESKKHQIMVLGFEIVQGLANFFCVELGSK